MEVIKLVFLFLAILCIIGIDILNYEADVLLHEITYYQQAIPVLILCTLCIISCIISFALSITHSNYVDCIIHGGLVFFFAGLLITSQLYAEQFDNDPSLTYTIITLPTRIGTGIFLLSLVIYVGVFLFYKYGKITHKEYEVLKNK